MRLLDMFVYQNRIFTFGLREVVAAERLAKTELFKMEVGECGGVSGYWLTMVRKISVTIG